MTTSVIPKRSGPAELSAGAPAGVFDVAVAGGGPAGAIAAWTLAREGASVLVLEKGALPRYKTCGGGIVRRVFGQIPFPVEEVVQRHCLAAEFNLPEAGLRFTTTRDTPIISMTMRCDFDAAILNEAVRAGAHLVAPCTVREIRQTSREVQIVTTEGEFRAQYLVAADGATGSIARCSGWAETRLLVPALECEVWPDSKTDSVPDSGTARFDFGAAPFGYGWVFPKREHYSIGILSMRANGSNLHLLMKSYLASLGIVNPVKVEKHGFVLPMRPRKDGFVRRRVLLAGDSAGFADPLTGEGITYAVLSGKLAARALLDSDFDMISAGEKYLGSLNRWILPELRWGILLSVLLYNNRTVRNWLFRRHGQLFCEAVANVVTGRSSYRELLARPSNYLKLITRRY